MRFLGKENILDLLYKIINNIIKIIILIYNISPSMTKLNSLHSQESANNKSKAARFIDNTRRAINKALTTTWIVASSFLPTSVNTITTTAPLTWAITTSVWIWTAASLFTACSSDDPAEELKDTTAPTISLSKSEIDITWWKKIEIIGNNLFIGDELIATRNDDVTKNCSTSLSLNWKDITSWTTLNESWTLTLVVKDAAGNSKKINIKLNIDEAAPNITVNTHEINIFWWANVNIDNNQLLIWDSIIAKRTDKDPESCKVSLKFNWKEITSWDNINEAWTLILSITNKQSKTSNAEITLTNDAIFGLEKLQNITIPVDKEIDLLNWLTLADGVTLVKTEIEINGKIHTITDPHHYTPEYPWNNISIIFTVQWRNSNSSQITVNNITISPLEYKSISISHLKPSDILPIIWQIDGWDKKCYEHIEHLRVAEATKIRDMMREYGAGSHLAEQYQQLMSRLNTGMLWENPEWYTNYEAVWWSINEEPSTHAHNERDILNTLIKHANFKVMDSEIDLYNLCKSNPNQINIIWCSVDSDVDKEQYDARNIPVYQQYDKEKNRLMFCAWGNIRWKKDWHIIRNKVYQEDYSLPDERSVYSSVSRAHNKTDHTLDRHLMITFGTDTDWDIDQTNEGSESSKFPIWFHDKVLFAGRAFPIHLLARKGWWVWWEEWKYATSYTNYVNVAMTDLCFQMFAEAKDVDQLLEMIRSTCLTDYIRFDLNGDGDTNDTYKGQPETQPLQLINPAWFFQKYLMPTKLPTQIKEWETIPLNKWYYKWVIFDIPWAEVKINWEWVAYTNANKSIIQSQNPMNLEWRINGSLCAKMWYKSKNLEWKIIVVDDKFHGLNITKDFSIKLQ